MLVSEGLIPRLGCFEYEVHRCVGECRTQLQTCGAHCLDIPAFLCSGVDRGYDGLGHNIFCSDIVVRLFSDSMYIPQTMTAICSPANQRI